MKTAVRLLVAAGALMLLAGAIFGFMKRWIYAALLCAVLFIAAGWLHHWLMTKGAKIFEAL